MFYSGNGKPVAPYDSSLVETLIIYVVRVKSKNEYNLDIILYPFLELQYSYPSWAQTSEYGTIQRSIAVYGQYKHGPYIPFYGLSSISPHTQRSLLCLRLECSSARGALCHDDSCDFDSNTFTSYFTSSVNQYCTEVQLSFCATMTLGVQLPFMGSMGVVKAGVIEWGQQEQY